jgi:hypothetical protein
MGAAGSQTGIASQFKGDELVHSQYSISHISVPNEFYIHSAQLDSLNSYFDFNDQGQ